ncbi:GCN5-related N-acetyltransferase 6, chloroplastic-like isoform X2 [Magnolia sinica]|uniref:GCN5-related N-acetyltransferase 6, chloroplastic-like isoform X2 n=1 Tax=Magnolia sinica TaxID=86752 RepID=UPI00265A9C1E|nr:GCN5-related N-acetyltransferase 6, chloroplastic-like isoform X2 [Magnolia sinica]
MLNGNIELVGSFVPRFHVSPPRLTQVVVGRRKCNPVLCVSKVSSSFGETFPVSHRRWKVIEVQCNDSSSIHQSSISHGSTSRLPELSFDRLQPSDQELCGGQRRVFGRFVARGAALDEEYWTAAWLRAEAHWESLSYMRHVDNYKRKYAEKEFYALKHRCSGRDGNCLKCFCIVAEVKRASGVLVNHEANDAHRYAYIANVCVAKYARRRGIATNMLHLATDVAISAGMKQLFVHVNADNKPAQELYRKTGFEVELLAKANIQQILPLFQEQSLLASPQGDCPPRSPKAPIRRHHHLRVVKMTRKLLPRRTRFLLDTQGKMCY